MKQVLEAMPLTKRSLTRTSANESAFLEDVTACSARGLGTEWHGRAKILKALRSSQALHGEAFADFKLQQGSLKDLHFATI